MYARRAAGRELTFDFAEGLLGNNLLVVDRETGSVWSQLHGKAVFGPLEGTPLEIVPSIQTTWKFWRTLHPDTRVVVLPGEEGRPYVYRRRRPGEPARGAETTHDTSRLGLGLVVGGEAIFFPFRELARAPSPVRIAIGGRTVLVRYEADGLTAWAEDEQGRLLPGVLVYEDGWREFYPDTRRFAAKGGS